MAQIGVDIGSYTFDKVAKTITFTGITIDDIEQIKPIVDGTAAVVIFNPAEVNKFGTLAGNVLTLQHNTNTVDFANTDKLYICLNDGLNQVVNLGTNDLGRDAWGRPKTITDKSLFHGMFTYNVPVLTWKERLNGVEIPIVNATSVNGKLNIIPTGTLNDITVLESFRNLRYKPNRGHLYSTAGYIVNPTAAMERDFGVFTKDAGTFFRVNTGGIYAVVATTVGGVYTEDERIIFTTAQLTTEGIDLSKGHTFDIQFQWRGVGNYKFFIDLQEVLTITYLNTRTELTMFNPSMPCSFRTKNLGDADAMEFGCVDVTSEGGGDNGTTYGSSSIDTQSGEVNYTGYNQPILAVRSKVLIGALTNTRDTLSLLASFYSDEKSIVRVWITRDFTAITEGNSSWVDHGDGHLEDIQMIGVGGTMSFDTAKAELVFGARVAKERTYSTSALFEGRTDIHLTPGDMFIFTMHRENAGATKGGVTFEYAEEI